MVSRNLSNTMAGESNVRNCDNWEINYMLGQSPSQNSEVKKYLKSKNPGKPRVFHIKSVSEFIELALWLYSSQNVIFRGQAKEWGLIPSVARDTDHSQFSNKEMLILEEFKRESIPYIDFHPSNNWQWLALAQHNRLPTRLLDWTKNPLAALWFAVKDPAVNNEPGVVWAFWYEGFDIIFNTINLVSPFSIDKTHLYFPEHIFPYIQAQSGVFTVHHRETNTDRFPPLEELHDADSRLTKIEIVPSSFPTIRYQLFRLGVSPASLFPGLYGLIEKIRYDNMLCKDERKT